MCMTLSRNFEERARECKNSSSRAGVFREAVFLSLKEREASLWMCPGEVRESEMVTSQWTEQDF